MLHFRSASQAGINTGRCREKRCLMTWLLWPPRSCIISSNRHKEASEHVRRNSTFGQWHKLPEAHRQHRCCALRQPSAVEIGIAASADVTEASDAVAAARRSSHATASISGEAHVAHAPDAERNGEEMCMLPPSFLTCPGGRHAAFHSVCLYGLQSPSCMALHA